MSGRAARIIYSSIFGDISSKGFSPVYISIYTCCIYKIHVRVLRARGAELIIKQKGLVYNTMLLTLARDLQFKLAFDRRVKHWIEFSKVLYHRCFQNKLNIKLKILSNCFRFCIWRLEDYFDMLGFPSNPSSLGFLGNPYFGHHRLEPQNLSFVLPIKKRHVKNIDLSKGDDLTEEKSPFSRLVEQKMKNFLKFEKNFWGFSASRADFDEDDDDEDENDSKGKTEEKGQKDTFSRYVGKQFGQ